MKIYFAGSIRGGRDDQDIYAAIITMLKQYGTVVTEYIGNAQITLVGEGVPDREIHDRDIGWLRECDLIVAEVTAPSLGVGYEIGRAVEWGKRIVCLYRASPGRKLSGMIAGSPGIVVYEYSSPPDLSSVFQKLFCV